MIIKDLQDNQLAVVVNQLAGFPAQPNFWGRCVFRRNNKTYLVCGIMGHIFERIDHLGVWDNVVVEILGELNSHV